MLLYRCETWRAEAKYQRSGNYVTRKKIQELKAKLFIFKMGTHFRLSLCIGLILGHLARVEAIQRAAPQLAKNGSYLG